MHLKTCTHTTIEILVKRKLFINSSQRSFLKSEGMHWENIDFKQNQEGSSDFGLGKSIYNLARQILYRYNGENGNHLNFLKHAFSPSWRSGTVCRYLKSVGGLWRYERQIESSVIPPTYLMQAHGWETQCTDFGPVAPRRLWWRCTRVRCGCMISNLCIELLYVNGHCRATMCTMTTPLHAVNHVQIDYHCTTFRNITEI